MKRGKVVLVGAGPGAPDLITLRGAAALRAADVVVYDALVEPEMLELAPPTARRIDVGKRGHDAPTLPQAEITALLLRLAAEGNAVVRLKGGDSYVFGRGGEEACAFEEAGIPFEVVPGVSSVIGALCYAGIPVTDRRHAASFAVVTGHKDPSKPAEETRWELLANAADTLVILMGMRNLEQLVARIVAAGRSAATPAAVVMNGTLPRQRVVEAPLGEIAERVRREGLGAPAVVVIGEVVRLRAALSWWERQPLFGRRVLVTRSEEQAGELVSALAEVGAAAVLAPMIRLLPPEDPSELDAALDALSRYDAVLFTSANAVRFLAARARERGTSLSGLRGDVVCVGPKTADAALAAGLPVHRVPEKRFDAEGVLEVVVDALSPRGKRLLLPRSEAAREALPEGLRAEGAFVDAVTAYRNAAGDVDGDSLRAQLVAGELDVLTFTSPSTAKRFAALLDDAALAAARGCVIAAIGPVTAAALGRLGLAPDVVSERAGARELVAALSEHVADALDAR